jgi:AraC-like DNA-binding protein
LSEIAQATGFADQSHFCRHFRQVTGQTPAAWRRAERRSVDSRQ